MKESAVASQILQQSPYENCYLWRNNSGALMDERGRLVRYGLGSFTKKDECKSSDYIGVTPLLIMPHHVGHILGVFTAIETKPSDWVFDSRDEHTLHQQKFIDIVLGAGGYAGFASNVDHFRRIIKHDTR